MAFTSNLCKISTSYLIILHQRIDKHEIMFRPHSLGANNSVVILQTQAIVCNTDLNRECWCYPGSLFYVYVLYY